MADLRRRFLDFNKRKMDYLSRPHRVRSTSGTTLGEGVWAVGGRCAHCNHPIGDELVLALGPPHMALLHRRCAPYFLYSNTWPHPLPLEAYTEDRVLLE